jgi:hypothetical protein
MALPVSLTPMRNYSAVSLTLVKLAKTEKVSLTGVNDAGNVCFAGVIDTS